MSYNLVDEKWIPVLYHDGRWEHVGIRKTLEDAHLIRQIATSNPMDRAAILRFLLALLYWCKGDPPGVNAQLGNSFPSEWFNKLERDKECFNLLGKGKRFYQHCRNDDKTSSANYLIQEIPTGTNLWHFRHSTDGNNGLCLACCAMGLLRLPLFATSAGRGYSPGVNQQPPIYAIPTGTSLAATLRLSWQRVSNPNIGKPAWEKPDQQLPTNGEVPFLMGLTWLPRRVWLDNPKEPETNCILCGCRERLILECVYAPIGSQKKGRDGQGRTWCDPHVIYEQKKKGEESTLRAGDVLGAPDAAAGQWAKIMAGILRKGKADNTSKMWVVGFATVQNDKYLEAMEYVMPFSCAQTRIQESSIKKIETWQSEGKKMRRPNKKASFRKSVAESAAIAAIRPHIEGRVSTHVGELIAGQNYTWEQAAHEYRPTMKMIAKSLSPGYTTAAVRRRRCIANELPDMRPEKEPAKKPGRKKGGNK